MSNNPRILIHEVFMSYCRLGLIDAPWIISAYPIISAYVIVGLSYCLLSAYRMSYKVLRAHAASLCTATMHCACRARTRVHVKRSHVHVHARGRGWQESALYPEMEAELYGNRGQRSLPFPVDTRRGGHVDY